MVEATKPAQNAQSNPIEAEKGEQNSQIKARKEGQVSMPLLLNRYVLQTGLGACNRDIKVKGEEEQGLIEFMVVKNDK